VNVEMRWTAILIRLGTGFAIMHLFFRCICVYVADMILT
jgi:hypothetical protein